MTSSSDLTFREDGVPFDGLAKTVDSVVELFGGEVTERDDGVVRFTLPRRRGVAVAGGIACRIEWDAASGETSGAVTLVAGREIEAPKGQRIALLVVGATAALLALAWPFYPEMAGLSGIGVIVAFATYFLTLRRTPGGTAAEILRRIARAQQAESTE